MSEHDVLTPNKANKRALSPSAHRKACSLCGNLADVLVRCQVDSSARWQFVCPSQCWRAVSGGVIDGDEHHPDYKYGGMWKNKHAGVSAKKKKGKGREATASKLTEWQVSEEDDGAIAEEVTKYTKNDKVKWDEKQWICRRSHQSAANKRPGDGWRWWKEID
ncbi:uncharacterized protein KY384_004381 [Bacidia gigantensis]|uniref:uncharacterized protein n=1 Tax=Bacidia gigantensis TaxID=2732470 RepID=UPI001D036293|nr:uncharacterized protein KY384_004381 [Bacidia gigantensis]KAG8531024.1 hypothetical protein KY384_004381 [Bacidia gigantensis]